MWKKTREMKFWTNAKKKSNHTWLTKQFNQIIKTDPRQTMKFSIMKFEESEQFKFTISYFFQSVAWLNERWIAFQHGNFRIQFFFEFFFTYFHLARSDRLIPLVTSDVKIDGRKALKMQFGHLSTQE